MMAVCLAFFGLEEGRTPSLKMKSLTSTGEPASFGSMPHPIADLPGQVLEDWSDDELKSYHPSRLRFPPRGYEQASVLLSVFVLR